MVETEPAVVRPPVDPSAQKWTSQTLSAPLRLCVVFCVKICVYLCLSV